MVTRTCAMPGSAVIPAAKASCLRTVSRGTPPNGTKVAMLMSTISGSAIWPAAAGHSNVPPFGPRAGCLPSRMPHGSENAMSLAFFTLHAWWPANHERAAPGCLPQVWAHAPSGWQQFQPPSWNAQRLQALIEWKEAWPYRHGHAVQKGPLASPIDFGTVEPASHYRHDKR